MNLQRKVDLQEKHIQTLERTIELLENENQILKIRNDMLTANESSVQLLQEQLKKDIESLTEIKGKYQQAIYDAQNLKKNFSQKFKKFTKEMKIDKPKHKNLPESQFISARDIVNDKRRQSSNLYRSELKDSYISNNDITNQPIIRWNKSDSFGEVIDFSIDDPPCYYTQCYRYEIRNDIFDKFIEWAIKENKKCGFELQ